MQLTTPSDQLIVVKRAFQAPRPLVFDSQTNARRVKAWFLLDGQPMTKCKINLKAGGEFHYVWPTAEGIHVSSRGKFKSIKRPEKILHQEIHGETTAENEPLTTTEYLQSEHGTTIRLTIQLASADDQTRILRSGYEHEIRKCFDLLDAYLQATLRSS